MILAKKEHALMQAIYDFANEKGGVGLIRPVELLERIPYNVEFRKSDLEPVLSVLELDEYIECVSTDKKGEKFYCITLKKKGKAYKRKIEIEKRKKKNALMWKIFFVIFGIILSICIKAILKHFQIWV